MKGGTGAALAACLADSDCVMVGRNKASDCLREPLVYTLPPRCRQLQQAYGQCKYDAMHPPHLHTHDVG